MVAAARFERFMEELPPKSEGTSTSAPSSKPKAKRAWLGGSGTFMWLVGGGIAACAFLLSIFIATHVSLENRFAALMKTLHDEMAKQTSAFDARFSRLDERFDKIDARFDKIDARFGEIDVRAGKFDQRLGVIETRLDALDTRLGALDTRLGGLDVRFSAHADRMHDQMLKVNTAIARLEAKTESAQPPSRETTPR